MQMWGKKRVHLGNEVRNGRLVAVARDDDGRFASVMVWRSLCDRYLIVASFLWLEGLNRGV